MSDRSILKRLILPSITRHVQTPPVASGLYPYTREHDGHMVRLHLRIEPDGQGTLVVNATGGLRLSPSGVVLMKGILDNHKPDDIIKKAQSYFSNTSNARIRADLVHLSELLNQLASPNNDYPIRDLTGVTYSASNSRLLAPFSADVTLSSDEKVNPILKRLWEAGVPHVILVSSAGTDPKTLVQAVESAEDLGMIAGVRIRATDLNQNTLLRDLAMTGVDHLTLPFASASPEIHDSLFGIGDHETALGAFTAILDSEICPVVQTPLTKRSVEEIEATLKLLVERHVANVQAYAIVESPSEDPPASEEEAGQNAPALPQLALRVDEMADEQGLTITWLPPLLRERGVRIAEQALSGPRCSAEVAIRVEADGSVIPPRGPRQAVGNLMTDDWSKIWSHEIFKRFRETMAPVDPCPSCPGLSICESECLLDPNGWTRNTAERDR